MEKSSRFIFLEGKSALFKMVFNCRCWDCLWTDNYACLRALSCFYLVMCETSSSEELFLSLLQLHDWLERVLTHSLFSWPWLHFYDLTKALTIFYPIHVPRARAGPCDPPRKASFPVCGPRMLTLCWCPLLHVYRCLQKHHVYRCFMFTEE